MSPRQLLDRLRLRVVLAEVLINQGGERQRAPGAVRPPHPLECPLERLGRVLLRGETATLQPSRIPPASPIPCTPKSGAPLGPFDFIGKT